MSTRRLRIWLKNRAVLMYHSAAFPSGPVPPFSIYTSVDRTPRPTKLEAAFIVGPGVDFEGNAPSCQLWFPNCRKGEANCLLTVIGVPYNLGPEIEGDAAGHEIRAGWQVHDGVLGGGAGTLCTATIAVRDRLLNCRGCVLLALMSGIIIASRVLVDDSLPSCRLDQRCSRSRRCGKP